MADETYTYIDAKGDKQDSTFASKQLPPNHSRIVGIKDNSKYVDLVNSDNKDITSLITSNKCNVDNGNYPIIVNSFAAHKYNLRIGDHISFNINNATNRIQNIIDGNTSINRATFKIVGINTTYQGEEYFTNQELANKLLGLRSRLSGNKDNSYTSTTLHNYYPNTQTLPLMPDMSSYIPQPDYKLGRTSTSPILNDFTSDKTNYTNPTNDEVFNPTYDNNGHDVLVNPYGFNGVFTQRSNGSTLLNGGFNLYSPSGLYISDDSITSAAAQNSLSMSSNLEVANIMCGLYKPDQGELQNPTDLQKLGLKIHAAYLDWSKASSDEDKQSTHDALISLVPEFVLAISTELFGNTTYTSLVSGALDKDSTNLIFENLSLTVSQVEYTVLSIITIMVVIIVMLITIMVIGDSKRLAAILKSLGYSDMENITSFLSIYVPVIILGLIIAIPLSFGLIAAFQSVIFHGAGILLLGTTK
ncbi:hypothetical protein FACS1894218_2080 [Bacilli bacterium]|nr:hypothetical protein FACS1894218_2080 [Bacilli bacterium]